MPNKFVTPKEAARRMSETFCEITLRWMKENPREAAALKKYIDSGGKVLLSFPTDKKTS